MSDDTTSHADESTTVSLTVVRNAPTVPGLDDVPEGPDDTLVVQGGDLRGRALDELGGILEQAMTSPHVVVRLDLTAVQAWSTLAQAMVLHAARVLDRRDARLVLVGASEDLRLQSRWLDVFERIQSED